MADYYEHPMNGHTEKVDDLAILWGVLGGPIYLLMRGLWPHVVLQFVVTLLGVLVFGVAGLAVLWPLWIIYVMAAPALLRKRYLRMGWRERRGSLA